MNFIAGQQMKPEQKSKTLLGITRSKAKMLEYGIPKEHHIKIPQDPAKLFRLCIAMLGDLSAETNRKQMIDASQLRNSLMFSAHFFDAYLRSGLNGVRNEYLILLCATSYYLC
jgi:POLQ-like helicase